MTERSLSARARPRASRGEAPGVYGAVQDRVAYRPIGKSVNRRDHRNLGGIPGRAVPAPLRELSEALFELSDRLASQSELDRARAD
jgi:hypothetical protein